MIPLSTEMSPQYPVLPRFTEGTDLVYAAGKAWLDHSFDPDAIIAFYQANNAFQYGEKEDYFHAMLTECLRSLKGGEFIPFPKEDIISSLKAHRTTNSAFSIIEQLENFKTQFPSLFEKKGYQRELDFLKNEVLGKYGVEFQSMPPKEEYTVHRPVSELKEAAKLVFGCGHARTSCGGHSAEKEYLVDLDPDTKPDLEADFDAEGFWNVLPSSRFEEVFFEGFGPAPSKSAFSQIHRILAEDGKVRVIYSEEYRLVMQAGREYLEEYFQSCGFASFEIKTVSGRSNGREQEGEGIILHKKSQEA